MDPNNYGNLSSSNWDEVVFSGAYGGTGHGATGVYKDVPGVNFGNDSGSPFNGGCPFVMCDGSVRMISYSVNTTAFDCRLYYTNSTPFTLN